MKVGVGVPTAAGVAGMAVTAGVLVDGTGVEGTEGASPDENELRNQTLAMASTTRMTTMVGRIGMDGRRIARAVVPHMTQVSESWGSLAPQLAHLLVSRAIYRTPSGRICFNRGQRNMSRTPSSDAPDIAAPAVRGGVLPHLRLTACSPGGTSIVMSACGPLG